MYVALLVGPGSVGGLIGDGAGSSLGRGGRGAVKAVESIQILEIAHPTVLAWRQVEELLV